MKDTLFQDGPGRPTVQVGAEVSHPRERFLAGRYATDGRARGHQEGADERPHS